MVGARKNGDPDERIAAVESSELSSDLLYTLVHELRNPLGPIRNAAELLRTLCTDPRQLQSVEIISRQVSSLTRALDDLSNVLNAKQSGLLLAKQTVDPSEVFEPALRAVRAVIDAQRQNLLVSLPNEPVHMYCDPLRLSQVVQTLLENAARHTPAGGAIALQVANAPGQLTIEVRDDGAGISPEKLAAVFNVFVHRGPETESGQPAGLNLALSRNIVEMHGGTIEAFSEGVGRGSRFVVQLPAEGAIAEAQVGPSISPDALRVLIIEDHEDNASSLRDVVAAAGHSVLVANTGEFGLALAETFKPDAVLLDIGLPGMDGFDVAKRLRADPTTADALLVAISGFSIKRFRDLSEYSAFRHYLLKPVDPQTILTIIKSARTRV